MHVKFYQTLKQYLPLGLKTIAQGINLSIQTLEASNNSLPTNHSILQHLFTGIIWVDIDLTIRWVNLQTEQLLSVSKSRLVDETIIDILTPCDAELAANHKLSSTKVDDDGHTVTDTSDTDILKQKIREQLASQFNNALRYQQPFIEYSRHINGVGHPTYVNYSVTPVEQNNETYFLIELWAKNRQSQIDRDQRQKEQHHVAREMLRSVAHEVKNPLAGIRGAAQLLNRHIKRQLEKIQPQVSRQDYINKKSLDQLLTDENKHKNLLLVDAKKLTTYSDIVISETDRLSDLISQLLGSNQLAQWEQVNIHEPLERVIILTETQYPIVKIVRDYDLSLPEITADKNQLIQMFLNLANNACEAMIELNSSELEDDYEPQLTLTTRIKFQCTIGDRMHRQVVEICVKDNGPGIKPELVNRIFFPMVTGRANGTGLGLALVKDMIHRHQGAIDVHSEPGNTAFCIYLPFIQEETQDKSK